MAITIRNKKVEAEVRQIGSETGEGPSAVVARLVGDEAKRLTDVEKLELTRRRHALRELLAMLPNLTEAQKSAMDHAERDMFNARGLPK